MLPTGVKVESTHDFIRICSFFDVWNFRCQCIPALCEPLICGEGKRTKLLQSGDGNPGNCCDQFVCVGEEGDLLTYFTIVTQVALLLIGISFQKCMNIVSEMG